MSCGQDCQCGAKETPPSPTTSTVAEVVGILKPYLLAVLIIAAGVLQYKQIIDKTTFNLILAVLGGGVAASVQATQKRIERKTDRALRSLEQ